MEDGELKVYYKAPTIDEKLDMALEEALRTVGFERWASGYDLEDRVRDIAFERRE